MPNRSSVLRVLGFLVLLVTLIPVTFAAAQSATDENADDGFILQVNRPVTVASGDSVDVVVVFDDDVVVDGTVTDTLVVIRGTATVNGEVGGDLYVFEGDLNLTNGATVDNVTLIRSDMTRAEGATISGNLDENVDYTGFGWAAAIFSITVWIGFTIAILLASLLIMAIFGRRIITASETISTRPLESGVAGLATWIILPILAVMAFVTIIGIPVGLGIVLVLIPILGLVGYIVAAHWVGKNLGALANLTIGRYVSMIIGLIALQLLGLIPWIGGIFVFLATIVGTGALIYRFYRDRREPATATNPVAPMGGPVHA